MFDLELKNVTVHYKDIVAINNASLEAKHGEIIGFIAGRKIPDKDSMHKALKQYKEMKAAE